MIPVLASPILNRGDLLIRLLRSIDCRVGLLVIVWNGTDAKVAQYLDDIQRTGVGQCDSVIIHHRPENLGVAGSWNLTIQEHPAPWWLIVGNDIAFSRGDLAKFDSFMQGEADMAFGNQSHSAFAITPRAVELAGTFDENYYPAYLEDCDYSYRCRLTGVRMANIPDTHIVHGDAPMFGSSTIYSNSRFRKANGISQANGNLYYRRKWLGSPGKETFTHPFDDPDWPINKWVLDEELRKANVW